MQNKQKIPQYLINICKKIEKCANENESDKLLLHFADVSSKNSADKQNETTFEKLSPVCYKYGEFYINAYFVKNGVQVAKLMKIFHENKIDFVPKFVTAVKNENTLYLISKIRGTKSGNLIDFNENYDLISQDSKMRAFENIKKMLALKISEKALENGNLSFFLTPDDKEIVALNLFELYEFDEKDMQKLLNLYEKIIFKK